MKRTDIGIYLVDSDESVSVRTTLPPHAGIRMTLNDSPINASVDLTLDPNSIPGNPDKLTVSLIGNPGDVANVNVTGSKGGSDTVTLVASTTAQTPAGDFTFIVPSQPLSTLF